MAGKRVTSFQYYLSICVKCPFRQQGCSESKNCLCTADGLGIEDHARDGHCPQNLYPKLTRPSVAHGVAGIAKAVAGAGGADAESIEKRSRICGDCEHNVVSVGLVRRCELCACLLWAKVRNLDEKCPEGKW
jgi:hypothetical protein